MEQVKAQYQQAFDSHGDSLKSLLIPKGRQFERFHSLCKHFKEENFSILDFGCGFGDLYAYLEEHFRSFTYLGIDIVEDLIKTAKKKYPGANFQILEAVSELQQQFNHVVVAGTFNLMYKEDPQENKAFVHACIQTLFEHCNQSLCLNFMTDQVDYTHPSAYHQNVIEIYEFARQNLSPRLQLDQSYMPYEYTLIVYKNAEILRPDNVYSGHK